MSLFKKFLKPIIITLIIAIILLVTAIILLSSFFNLRKALGLDFLSKDEMAELLEEDLELFTQVAEAYDSLRTEGAKSVHTENVFWLLEDGFDYNYVYLNRGFVVVANSEFEWTDERIARLKNSKPWKVLSKWDIKDICVSRYSKGVFFTNRLSHGASFYLVYCKEGVPEYKYISRVESLRENWYYCVMEKNYLKGNGLFRFLLLCADFTDRHFCVNEL